MRATNQSAGAERYREQAHELARDGVAYLARAMNLFSAPETPFRYTQDVHEKMFSLGVEIARLFEYGDIEPNPEHVVYRRALAARSDKTLQAVLRQARKGRNRRTSNVFKGQSS